ncbi:MAG: twin-arginine translocase subunit TatB [Magnetococcales bacterium]|nr:twin-arginine translocase subunit TatB [Magnetococcales bacterium]
MLGMGWSEILLICVVAIIVIGPDKLPEVARGLGRTVRQGRRLINELRQSIDLEEIERYREASPMAQPVRPPAPPSGSQPVIPVDDQPIEPSDGFSAIPSASPAAAVEPVPSPASIRTADATTPLPPDRTSTP